jgi:replicative DNA helicase
MQPPNKKDSTNPMYGRVPPQAKEFEAAVLVSIMLEKNAYDVVNEILKPEAFYSDTNQRIFKSFQRLASKNLPIDLMTTVEELSINGELDLVGGAYGVSKLTNAVVSSANIEVHSRIILQKYLSRELIRVSSKMISKAYDESNDVFDLLNEAEEGVSGLRMNNVKKHYKSLQSIMSDNINKLEDLRMAEETITGAYSGFSELDMVTCGWQPTDLIILAARPSVGKTAFALTLAKNASRSKKPVAVGIFSLEMKDSQLVNRILAQESDVWLWRMKNGRLNDEHMEQIRQGERKLLTSKIFVDDTPSISIQEFRSKARIMKRKENIGMIIVDYLQLMTAGGKGNNREQEISLISRELKACAKELDIPVIALSQLSRELEKGGGKIKREPQLSDLRESGAIEQDADMVMFLYKPSDGEIAEDADLQDIFYCKIEKHRSGALAKFIGKFTGENQTHHYLKVVNTHSLQPMGSKWKPVAQVAPPVLVNYSEPQNNNTNLDDLPF